MTLTRENEIEKTSDNHASPIPVYRARAAAARRATPPSAVWTVVGATQGPGDHTWRVKRENSLLDMRHMCDGRARESAGE